jgi:hypothetical protein
MTAPHEYEHTAPEDVLEHEQERTPETIVAVPVTVDGPVQVQSVGAVGWSSNNYSVGATNPTQIAQPQAQRSYMIINCGGVIYLGRTEAEARAKTGYRLGAVAGVDEIPMRHREEVWAISDTGTVVVSVYQEFWSS